MPALRQTRQTLEPLACRWLAEMKMPKAHTQTLTDTHSHTIRHPSLPSHPKPNSCTRSARGFPHNSALQSDDDAVWMLTLIRVAAHFKTSHRVLVRRHVCTGMYEACACMQCHFGYQSISAGLSNVITYCIFHCFVLVSRPIILCYIQLAS
ncbi:hypothetical protein GGI35DRAFT_399308 [Trichoderma velutinum]